MSNKDAQQIWQRCLAFIKKEIPQQSYDAWFAPILPITIDEGNTLILRLPTRFHMDWLEDRYVDILQQAIISELGKQGRLRYQVAKSAPPQLNNSIFSHRPQVLPKPSSRKTAHTPPISKIKSNLQKKYTFDNFIEGPCNRLAYGLGIKIAKTPGKSAFNPLLVYGGTGFGKTHLITAIGNAIVEAFPHKNVLYTTATNFTNEYVKCIRNRSIDQFNSLYLNLDVLIIDDIQFMVGKEKTQEQLFHLFNHLYQNNKQIIISCDRALIELPQLSERLASRLKQGQTADMFAPNYETRLDIINTILEREKQELPQDVIYYIAQQDNKSFRDLEGILNALTSRKELLKITPDKAMADQILSNYTQKPRTNTTITIDQIQEVVADHFRMEHTLLLSKSRKKEIVNARQMAMHLADIYTQLPLKAIGAHFGGRDHTTVIHARKAVSKKIKEDPEFAKSLEQIQRLIDPTYS
ncbi:MAG: chromosomal replication initiator protein DnaA [Bernardetiaceae bacterium]